MVDRRLADVNCASVLRAKTVAVNDAAQYFTRGSPDAAFAKHENPRTISARGLRENVPGGRSFRLEGGAPATPEWEAPRSSVAGAPPSRKCVSPGTSAARRAP